MANDNEVLRLLASIDHRLALLSASQQRNLRQALEADLLTTPARIAMFDALEQKVGGAELGRIAGVTPRAGQLFVKELLELGFVRETASVAGRSVAVERDDDAILTWYLARTTDA